MKGSTAGARHLAESANWLAWNWVAWWYEVGGLLPLGALMETVLQHWDAGRFEEFLEWRRGLPC